MTTTSARSICTRITQRLAQSVGPRRYSIWFDRTARFDYDDQHRRLDVAVPNQFVAEWIGRHYGDNLRHAASHEVGQEIDLRVQVHPELFVDAAPVGVAAPAPAPTGFRPAAGHAPGTRRARPGTPQGLGPGVAVLRHRLDEFIVGPSNELALAAAVRLAEDDRAANTLFLHGGCGLGKTHLLQGVCARVLERNPQARVLYTTAEQFTNEFLVGVRSNRIDSFRKRVRALDLLAVDDVHFLANKQATQQEFLHSFDALELGGARVVLASDNHPKHIAQFSEALVSRCIRGMVVEIDPPDTATRAQIVRALAQRRGIPLLDTVVEVIASRCVGSVRELEGLLAKLHALASLTQHRRTTSPAPGEGAVGRTGPTLPSGPAQDATDATDQPTGARAGGPADASAPAPGESSGHAVLEPIGHTLINHLFDSQGHATPRRAVRFEHVLTVVTDQLQVTRAEMHAGGRHQRVVLARGLVAYLARQMTAMSYPEIAAALGRKTHSTVITASQRIEKQLGAGAAVTLPITMEQLSLGDLVERLKHAIMRG